MLSALQPRFLLEQPMHQAIHLFLLCPLYYILFSDMCLWPRNSLAQKCTLFVSLKIWRYFVRCQNNSKQEMRLSRLFQNELLYLEIILNTTFPRTMEIKRAGLYRFLKLYGYLILVVIVSGFTSTNRIMQIHKMRFTLYDRISSFSCLIFSYHKLFDIITVRIHSAFCNCIPLFTLSQYEYLWWTQVVSQ